MTDGIEATTTATLSLALDAASLRHQAIASKLVKEIALLGGDVSKFVSAQRSLNQQGFVDPSTLAGVGARLEAAFNSAGQPVALQLDSEVAQMAQNSVHYQALVKGLSHHMSLLMSAASDGKK